jgi:hypothetical protein
VTQICKRCGGKTLGPELCFTCRLRVKAALADQMAAALKWASNYVENVFALAGTGDREEADLQKMRAALAAWDARKGE